MPARTGRFTYFAIGLVVLAVVVITLRLLQPDPAVYFTTGWLVLVAVLVWWGNRLLTIYLDKILPWSRGNFRFFVQLLIGLVFLLLLVNATYLVLKSLLTTEPPTHEQIIVMNVWGALIFVPAYSIYFSLHFLKHWRKSELEVERYHKENIRTQLELLKNHLDPHFLFNNLNILSALVDKDPQRSKLFIEKLADVYRQLLRTKSGDLISLREELEFIDAYMYLLRTRFDHHILFTLNLKPGSGQCMLPPATLQMLVENAIKHNRIHASQPLAIQLLQLEDDYLIVSNTLNEKEPDPKRQGSGLQNIRNRYAHFTDKPVKIQKTETHFEVHIPLLEVETL
jgi:sensor histidine kinase YesM